MKKNIETVVYKLFVTISILICVFLIIDGIGYVFCGHFSLFVNLNYSLPLSGLEELLESLERNSQLYRWYSPIFSFLHKAVFISNLVYLLLTFLKIDIPNRKSRWIHIVALIISCFFLAF